MKLTLTIPILAAMLGMTGCTNLLSTNSFTTEEEAIHDPYLPGTWVNNDKDTILIRQNGKTYDVAYLDSGKDTVKFTGRLVRAGDALLLDLSENSDDPFVLPLHFAARVWPEAGGLRWTLVDSDWLKEQATQTLMAHREGDRTIITSPGPAVREFVRKFGVDDRAHGNIETWTRAQ